MHKQTRFFHSLSYLGAFLILFLATLGYLVLFPNEIPLFYSLYRLQDQLVPKLYIFILPGLAVVFTLISHWICRRKEIDDTASVLHALGNTIIVWMMALALIRIVFLMLP